MASVSCIHVTHCRLTIFSMKGDLTGILRFRIIGYQEMLSFLISRQLMSFALRLIKKIELKTLTDFFVVVWLGSFIASHPEKHVGDSSVLPGTVELQWQVTSLQELKWSSHFTYKALSKSMRLVHTVSQTVTFSNGIPGSILCIGALHELENDHRFRPGMWRCMNWPQVKVRNNKFLST